MATATSDQTTLPADVHVQQLGHVCELSRIELDAIVKLELLAPEATRVEQKPLNQQHRVRAVYGTAAGHAALLGDSILRRGETLPQGGEVLDVSPEGIQVAPSLP